jgi:predicted transposase/invertase (TIGR01784 family)
MNYKNIELENEAVFEVSDQADIEHKKHNNFFISSMSNKKLAKEFFSNHLPIGLKNKIDLETLEFCKESYIDKKLKMSQVDVLYKVNFNDNPGYIYSLMEHQSTCDKKMAFRMFKYMMKIMDHHIKGQKDFKLPVIVPLVFYHGRLPYTGTTNIFDLFYENKELAQSIFLKPFQLVDVTTMSDEVLKAGGYSGIMEFVMKHIHTREILVYLEQIAGHLRGIEDDKTNEDFLTSILRYVILNGEADDKTKVIDFIKRTFTEKTSKNMATIAAQFKEEGRQEGTFANARKIALNLLRENVPVSVVSKCTDLSIEEINKIRKEESETYVNLK